MRWLRIAAAAAAALALGACATMKPPAPKHPPPAPPSSVAPAPAHSAPVPATSAAPPPAPAPVSFWDRMRARFAMPGCDADPAIVRWAKRFTRHPRAFEARLRWALPTLQYIEGVARQHHVAAEFALVPWVESRYRAEWPRHGGSAGMWQIVPITARSLHLPVRRDYDGRLDRVAATAAVMGMLARYHRRWEDWRVVDMAYNAGEYRIRRRLPSGPAPARPVIPDLHVSSITRHHLLQVLAMACVIRQPQRFGVSLPDPAPDQRLQVVTVARPLNLATAARLSGLPERRVRTLNAAYLRGRMPAGVPHRLLLPAAAADRFHTSYAALAKHWPPKANASEPLRPARYVVAPGDSLWSIAHRFELRVKELKRWNHLRSNMLHPGHVLRLHAPR